ncbi:MAG: energy-coupling factor transporter ATPase [Lachnospiraceae bacterium]
MGIIKIKDLIFQYIRESESEEKEVITAIDGVNLEVKKGEFVVILGHNGSGKSSLAKQLNAILEPTEGTVYIKQMDTKKEENIPKIRQTAGMVFQNPDNQIVATIVEEDVAFGPENIGVETDEIWKRVSSSLKAVGMEAFRLQSPNHLSGGQKQRVAIAGVMAMEPECIILDEPTAMLDPKGREDVIATVKQLNEKKKITILLITHNMEEAIDADKIFVMDKGKVVMQGTPRDIFSQVKQLKDYGLEVPHATELAYQLRQEGLNIRADILSNEELVEELCQLSCSI